MFLQKKNGSVLQFDSYYCSPGALLAAGGFFTEIFGRQGRILIMWLKSGYISSKSLVRTSVKQKRDGREC